MNDQKLTVAAIGPAGENLVKYALILATNTRPGAKKGIAGRCGMGAVMGSKNLKAIAVRAGKTRIALHDPAAFQTALRPAIEMLPDDMTTQVWRSVGTSGSMDYLGLVGDVPAKYWTQGTFDYASISGNTLAETILTGRGTCHACMVACGRKVARAAGHDLPHAEGPEYETLAAFGSLMLNDDLEMATYIGSQCDALGLDTLTAGSTIAFAMFLREQGLVPASAFDGADLRWSDPAIGVKDRRDDRAARRAGRRARGRIEKFRRALRRRRTRGAGQRNGIGNARSARGGGNGARLRYLADWCEPQPIRLLYDRNFRTRAGRSRHRRGGSF